MLKTLFGELGRRKWLEPTSPPSEGGLPESNGYVAFVVPAQHTSFFEPTGSYSYPLASTRLRVLAPARELSRVTRVALIPPNEIVSAHVRRAHGDPRATVLAKVSSTDLIAHTELFRNLLALLRKDSERVPVFADFSDDYSAMAGALGNPFLVEYQRELARFCALTVPCAALAERLRCWSDQSIHVIEDPWERPHQKAAAFAPGGVLKLCWFGNLGPQPLVSSLEKGVSQALDRLRGRPAQLDVVTATGHRSLALEIGARLTKRFPALTFRFIPWSLEAQWSAIDSCDLVLLPQDHRADWGSVKSHNRMVEALRAGRLAIASPVPSYCELAAYAWVGEDLGDGVDWALANPKEAVARVTAGQAYLPQRFSPEVVGRKWSKVLGIAPSEALNRIDRNGG
jgi:hypothetical protein